MEKVNILYNNLENNIPFCFIKVNDGEVSAMIDVNCNLSRGDEKSSIKLSEKIKECILYNSKNYYIGLPCSLCYNDYYNKTKIYTNDNSNILNANILINTNVNKTLQILTKTMKNKNIVIVTNITNLKNIAALGIYNINPYKVVIISEKYAFENDYEKVKNEYKNLNDNDIVLCLCGPLGRILCYEWFKNNNTLTCLELGSLFDPLLRNKAYLYHLGTHKYCDECFPSHESNECNMLSLCDKPINKECYYFNDISQNLLFYNNNIKKIKKNNDIRIEKDPSNSFLLKINSLCNDNSSSIDFKNNRTIKLELENHDEMIELKSNIPRENSKPIYIVYHIAAINEKWIDLTQKSYNKLIKSNILSDKNLKGVKISYLGDKNNIEILKNIWNDPKVEIINMGDNFKLYEYPAIELIKKTCKDEDCNILYFHCKGLLHENNSIDDWIEYLEYFNIEKYKHCLDKLIDHDVVGCNYYGLTGDKYYKNSPYYFLLYERHFSGNFWWSKSSYINTLDNLPYNSESRHKPEFWICKNEYGNFWSYYVASIDFGNNSCNNGNSRKKLNRNYYEGFENISLNFCIKNDYKHYNKNELFDLCKLSYLNKNISRLNVVSDIYLSFFSDLTDENTNKVKFWNGYSLFNINKKKSKKQFKQLYNIPTLSDDYKFYTKCNLDMLYGKNNNKIPKIIHLIYLKGIEFINFHYKCVKSILKYMPDYKIIIYNDVEPVENKYWNNIKKLVTIEKITPPDYFDNFPLKYIQYKADVIRLEKLYKYGGVYLDLDMLIIKNFDNILNTGKDFYISEENEKGGGLINAFIASKPENGFIKKWLESFKVGLRMDNWAYHIRDSNRLLLEKNKHYYIKYNIEILESKHFFPFKWSEKHKFQNINENLNDDIYGIHLYETILYDCLISTPYFNDDIV